MEKQWKVMLYRSSRGDYPVKEFIDSLEIKTQLKIKDTINLLQEFGIRLSLPHVKKLTGTELWELRIVGHDSVRILYVALTGRFFFLLHGFKKKKNKTPTKDIKIAEDRFDDLKSRIET